MNKLFKNPYKVYPQLLAAGIGSWGFFLTGVIRGWNSPGVPSLNATRTFPMDDNDLAWIVGLPPLCALTGALLISSPMQFFGRRKSLIFLCIPFIIGFQMMGLTYYVRHKGILFAGRVLSALMNGAATPASQIYISECSSPRVRGVLSSLTSTTLALGILVSYIIGAFVPWNILLHILGSFPLLLLVGMMFMPETPVWLLANNREAEAREALQWLRGKRTNVEAELQRIKNDIQKASKQDRMRIRDFLKPSIWKPLAISMGLMFFQNFTGINAMVFYTVSIFDSAGSTIDKNFTTIIVGFVQLICTAFSGALVDKYGRRILLIGSASVCSLALASMGTFYYFQSIWGKMEASETLGWLPLASLIVFFIAYSFGYTNVPYIIMGELFPARYRNILGSVSSSFNLTCVLITVRGFPAMQSGMTRQGTFWFFMCCTVLSIFFVYFLLPETKGKTLEDIAQFFGETYAQSDNGTANGHVDVNEMEKSMKSNGLCNPGFHPDPEYHPNDAEDEQTDGHRMTAPH